ncbi:hypothetical protein GCM10022275_19480 [Tessaracoccus defluvii]
MKPGGVSCPIFSRGRSPAAGGGGVGQAAVMPLRRFLREAGYKIATRTPHRWPPSAKPIWWYADRRLAYCALRTGTSAST